jgi:phosphomevalonate kinase
MAGEAAGFDAGSIESLRCRITVDSSELYRDDGSKRGLGSSAAVSVLLSAILLRLFRGARPEQPPEQPPEQEEVFRVALGAHRLSQGGRGSGYDVAASCFGGLGLFKGGEKPAWKALAGEWIPALGLFPGPGAVATAPAIESFERWRQGEPDAFESFVAASNAAVRGMVASTTWNQAAPAAVRLGELGRKLGRDIGVPAEVPETLVTCLEKENHSSLAPQPTTIKAVGAGGELYASFGYGEVRTCSEGQKIRIVEGLRWHT